MPPGKGMCMPVTLVGLNSLHGLGDYGDYMQAFLDVVSVGLDQVIFFGSQARWRAETRMILGPFKTLLR